jgi:hypothetical protein
MYFAKINSQFRQPALELQIASIVAENTPPDLCFSHVAMVRHGFRRKPTHRGALSRHKKKNCNKAQKENHRDDQEKPDWFAYGFSRLRLVIVITREHHCYYSTMCLPKS